MPSVTAEAEKPAICTVAVLNPAHCASVGLKLSDVEAACGAGGASGFENKPFSNRYSSSSPAPAATMMICRARGSRRVRFGGGARETSVGGGTFVSSMCI